MSAREIIRVLQDHGFVVIRQRGSHIAMQRMGEAGLTTTVIVPDHSEIHTGTLQSIIRQSGLTRDLFEV